MLLADGRPVEIQSRPFDILEFLVSARDRVVSREEVTAHVWRDVTVAENNLTVQMSALRRILANHGAEGLIITLPGRGYRFIGDVNIPQEPMLVEADVPPPLIQPRWRDGLIVAFAFLLMTLTAGTMWWNYAARSGPPRLSIAVLPFRDLSDERSRDYMADAVSDDLTTDLSHIPGSSVIARESADSYRGRSVDIVEIGRALNVRYVLEGSLREEDGDFHINAQLIDAVTGMHLWAERFETPLERLGDTRTAIVRRIASALDTELTELEGERGLVDRPQDPDALSLFYRARSGAEHDDSLAGLGIAQGELEAAIRQQPQFGDAYAELGLTLIHKVLGTDDPDNDRDLAAARSAIARALQLAPQNPTALGALARLRMSDGQCGAATYSAMAALASEPNSVDALAVLAKCAISAGKLDSAANYEQTILRLNPESRMNKIRYALLAQIRLLQGQYHDALALIYQALAGENIPNTVEDSMGRIEYAKLMQIAAYQLSGDSIRAHELFLEYNRLWKHRSVWRIGAYASAGEARLPGYARFLTGLQAAGMPDFVVETDDERVPASTTAHFGGDFDPTPVALAGASRIDTSELNAWLKKASPLIIDFGRGGRVIEGATWMDRSLTQDNDNSFFDKVMSESGHGLETPVVIMASGSFGFDSYNVALHAISRGFRKVYWYRGGEESWARYGLPGRDRRPL